MSKINEIIEKQLNDHVSLRMRNEGIFQSFRSYFMNAGFTKISEYFKSIAENELEIRDKIQRYLLERGGYLCVQLIPAVREVTGEDVVKKTKELMQQYFDIMAKGGSEVSRIYMQALSDDDATTCAWLGELMTQQVSMEKEARELVHEFGFCKNEIDTWTIDQHLKYVQFTF